MNTGTVQFPVYPPEVSYSNNQLEPGTDSRGYLSESPPFSPSCHLDLLRLSSESDDGLEIHSPISLSSLGFAIDDENLLKNDGKKMEQQEEVSFDSVGELHNKFVFEGKITRDKEITIKSGQKSERRSKLSRSNIFYPHSKDQIPFNYNQPTGKLTSKEKTNSCKDQTRGPRRDSFSEVKEQSDSESAATRENVLILSSSHPLPAESREENVNMSCPVSPRKSPVSTTRKTNLSTRASTSTSSVVNKKSHIKYHEDARVAFPSTRKTRVGSAGATEGSTLETPSLKDRKIVSKREKYKEKFKERKRKTAVPFLPKIHQPHRSSFPVFQKSHWESHKKSPDLAARNIYRSPRASQSPEALREKDSPGTFRGSENATNEQWSRAGDFQIKRQTESEKNLTKKARSNISFKTTASAIFAKNLPASTSSQSRD